MWVAADWSGLQRGCLAEQSGHTTLIHQVSCLTARVQFGTPPDKDHSNIKDH